MKRLLHFLPAVIFALSSGAFAGMPGPYLIKDIAPGRDSAIPDFSRFRAVGNTLLFAATEKTNGYELWKSDGTAAGTVLVKDILSGSGGSEPSEPIVAGGVVYFRATDADHGRELWKSNGTAAGTIMVKDVRSGSYGSYPYPQCVVGNSLYFSATTDVSGTELWITNGTAVGTTQVADITPGAGSTSFSPGVSIGSIYYFTAKHPALGAELWRTDGTPGGTYVVKDIAPPAIASGPAGLCVAGGVLYFVEDDGLHGSELWRSDGSSAGTSMVKDIAPGTAGGAVSYGMTVAGGLVYFSAHTTADSSDWSIWRSDGTAGGTFPLLAVANPHTNPMYVVGNDVFFFPSVWGGPYQVWKSDGTVAGTAPFKPGMSSGLGFLFNVGNGFYFGGSKAGDLWQSDGTSAGTYAVADLSAGATLSNAVNRPSLVAGKVYFDASDSAGGNELYAYDITPPSISRAEISERTKTSARIDLAVNPNGTATAANLEYGPTESYGTTVYLPVTATGDKSRFQSFSVPLAGLTLGTTYSYRITATSAQGNRVSTGTFDTVLTREDWRLARFGSALNTGSAADQEDPDHDGLTNLLEYAFGLDPLAGDAGGVPQGRIYSDAIVQKFSQPPGISDIVYGVEWSTTMAPGSWQAATDTGSGNLHSFTISTIWQPMMFSRWTVTPQ